MRINPTQLTQHRTINTPKLPSTPIQFRGIVPIHDTTDSTSQSSLAPRDAGILIFAGMTGIPFLLFGTLKLVQYFAHRSERRHLEQAHARMLADAEESSPERQDAFRMNPIRRPENALTRAERLV